MCFNVHFLHDSTEFLDSTVQNLQMSILERNMKEKNRYIEDLFDIFVQV